MLYEKRNVQITNPLRLKWESNAIADGNGQLCVDHGKGKLAWVGVRQSIEQE